MPQKVYTWHDFRDDRARADAYIPRVSVQLRGNVGLNKAAFEALEEPEAVIFRYSDDRRAFAIRRAEPGEKGARLVRKQNASASYIVGAKAFSNLMGFKQHLQTFRPTVADGMLIIDLDEAENDGEVEE